jgi:hypothetical protein
MRVIVCQINNNKTLMFIKYNFEKASFYEFVIVNVLLGRYAFFMYNSVYSNGVSWDYYKAVYLVLTL